MDATTVIVPVIGRFAGAGGTQWRTDLFIANHSSLTKTITMTFYVTGAASIDRTVDLGPYSAVSLPDVTLNTFGLSNAAGALELRSSNQSAFEARARIYNAGNAVGEFGQNVPAVGSIWLSRQSFLYGLSGINGNRVNVGITNPNDVVAAVNMKITDKDNNTLYTETLTIQPHQNVQYNDIFVRFGIAPRADVQVELNAQVGAPIFGYASEVRNDTGDAIFVVGTSPNA
jgi:hypothetical protein